MWYIYKINHISIIRRAVGGQIPESVTDLLLIIYIDENWTPYYLKRVIVKIKIN